MAKKPTASGQLLTALSTMLSTTFTLTQADFDAFARLSGDDNPIHVDPAFAARTRFGRTVSHGMLLYSVLCGFLNQQFPGAIQVSQSFTFRAPTYADEPSTLQVTVLEQLPDNQVRLGVVMARLDGTVTVEGETVVKSTED